ncbi:hypothetical protein D3C81_2144220 [compost metagenome]
MLRFRHTISTSLSPLTSSDSLNGVKDTSNRTYKSTKFYEDLSSSSDASSPRYVYMGNARP